MALIVWRAPWSALDGDASSEERRALDAELRRELTTRHVLAARTARAVGRREDTDDVLFELDGGPEHAAVHLTWKGQHEDDPLWPATELYADETDVNERLVRPDSDALWATREVEATRAAWPVIEALAAAWNARDGAKFAACFTADGIYVDGEQQRHEGRAAIGRLAADAAPGPAVEVTNVRGVPAADSYLVVTFDWNDGSSTGHVRCVIDAGQLISLQDVDS